MSKKLSEYIREGAKLRPQAFGNYIQAEHKGKCWEYSTCALGAAYEALTGEIPLLNESTLVVNAFISDTIYQACDVKRVFIPFPESVLPPTKQGTVTGVVVVLNDEYGWTREQIADYLESLGY